MDVLLTWQIGRSFQKPHRGVLGGGHSLPGQESDIFLTERSPNLDSGNWTRKTFIRVKRNREIVITAYLTVEGFQICNVLLSHNNSVSDLFWINKVYLTSRFFSSKVGHTQRHPSTCRLIDIHAVSAGARCEGGSIEKLAGKPVSIVRTVHSMQAVRFIHYLKKNRRTKSGLEYTGTFMKTFL